jgi:hypothetical protein
MDIVAHMYILIPYIYMQFAYYLLKNKVHRWQNSCRVPFPCPPPKLVPYSHLPDEHVEEGEILDDEPFNSDIGKKQIESDVDPGKIDPDFLHLSWFFLFILQLIK